jgi:MFS family permease
MLLALVSTAGYLVSWSFWPLLLSRMVWGIAFALISVGGVAIVLDLSPAGIRGRAVGTYQSLLQLGTLLGLILSGVLTDLFGYRGTLLLYVPLAALGLAVAAPALRGVAGGAGGRSDPAGSPGGLAALLRLDPRLLAPAYVNFASLFAGSGVLMSMLGVHLTRLAAAPGGLALPVATLTGVLLGARRLAGMLEAAPTGRLLDRLGVRRPVAALGVIVSLGGFALLAAGGGAGSVVAGVVLIAMGEGVLHPAVVVWTGDGAPAGLRGVVMGGLATAGDLGAALGPLVGYALLGTAGLGAAYLLCAGLLLSALLVLALGSRPDGRASRP